MLHRPQKIGNLAMIRLEIDWRRGWLTTSIAFHLSDTRLDYRR